MTIQDRIRKCMILEEMMLYKESADRLGLKDTSRIKTIMPKRIKRDSNPKK